MVVVVVAAAAAAGCSGALAAGSGGVIWAEIGGEEGAGGFGVAGRSEAIRGVGYEFVSSARTNAEAGYPLMTREVLWQRCCDVRRELDIVQTAHMC